jgi:hypothetical protein
MGKVRAIDGDQEQLWRMAIETWQASGLSVRQFCTAEGLSEPSFYSWRKKLTGGSVQDDKDKPEPSSVKIFVYTQPADMRSGFNRLSMLAESFMLKDPFSGHSSSSIIPATNAKSFSGIEQGS